MFNEGLYDIHIELKQTPLLGWDSPDHMDRYVGEGIGEGGVRRESRRRWREKIRRRRKGKEMEGEGKGVYSWYVHVIEVCTLLQFPLLSSQQTSC